jgi:hypothetical protein
LRDHFPEYGHIEQWAITDEVRRDRRPSLAHEPFVEGVGAELAVVGAADEVPEGLSIPRWSWDGLQD